MKPFLQVGIVAAVLQLLAVAILAMVTISFVEPEPSAQMLAWMYLTIATGLALTTNRYAHLMTDFVRRASRLLDPTQPTHASTSLTVQLALSAVLFAALALQSPPHFLNDIGSSQYAANAASIIWFGGMSAAVAGFGATAHAAYRAVNESNDSVPRLRDFDQNDSNARIRRDRSYPCTLRRHVWLSSRAPRIDLFRSSELKIG